MGHLVYNAIQTPDGTILESFHRHDFKTHTDAITGEVYMVDGGIYYRRGFDNQVPAKDLSLTTDSPFHLIREKFRWGTRGKSGNEPTRYVPLCKLESDHIKAIIETQTHIPDYIRKLFELELEFRKQ